MYECDEVAHDAQLKVFFQQTEEWFDALSKQLTVLVVENWPQNCHPNPRYVEEEYFDVEEEDYDIKKEDEYVERVCVVNWDSPPIYDDYLEDYGQGDKIELNKNKFIYIQDEPITHIVDETFDIQKQKVIDPFWEDFIEQELIEVNKRRERMILSNLCGGGNMKFMDVCMDSFFSTYFLYPIVAKEVKNKNSYIKIYYEWEKIDK